MTFSWTTAASTIAAILSVVLGVMTSVLGCHAGAADMAATCSSTLFSPAIMGFASIAFGAFAFVAKLIGAGGPLANLFGQKAVVLPENDPHSGVGTTTPAEVARP
jgi:hypothetical protein